MCCIGTDELMIKPSSLLWPKNRQDNRIHAMGAAAEGPRERRPHRPLCCGTTLAGSKQLLCEQAFSQEATAKHVEVKMLYHLVGIGTSVRDHPKAALRYTFGLCHLVYGMSHGG